MTFETGVFSLKEITFIGETSRTVFHSIGELLLSGEKSKEINATLTVKEAGTGTIVSTFVPDAFLFKTNSDTQTLSITIDSPEKFEDDNGVAHPRFHFLAAVPSANGFITHITHENPNSAPVDLPPSEISPSHTNKITLNLRMPGKKPKTSFYMKIIVWDRKNIKTEGCDPQVGNDPP